MEFSNTDSVIDSRDIIERIEELENEEMDCHNKGDCSECENFNDGMLPADACCEELKTLKELESECNWGDWTYGTTLIHENYFTEYAEGLCVDCGEIPSGLPWYIANHIDWDGVANTLKMDYTEVDFDGEAYFLRS